MEFFSKILAENKEMQRLSQTVSKGSFPILMTGLGLIHKAHYIYTLSKQTDQQILVIMPDEKDALRLCQDINMMYGSDEAAMFFVERDYNFRNIASFSHDFEHQRLKVLESILSGVCRVAVACINSCLTFTPSPEIIKRSIREIKIGGSIELDEFTTYLTGCGYKRSQIVDGIGLFSARGGIVDFFSPNMPYPFRIELFSDEVDTISLFDPQTQRRIDEIPNAKIIPATEIFYDNKKLASKISSLTENPKKKQAKAYFSLTADYEKLNQEISIPHADRYLPLIYPEFTTILDYFKNQLIIISDYTDTRERAKGFINISNQNIIQLFEEGILCPGLDNFYIDFSQALGKIEDRCIVMESFVRSLPDISPREHININAKTLSPWGGSINTLIEDLVYYKNNGFEVYLLTGTEKIQNNLIKELSENNIPATIYDKNRENKSFLKLTSGSLTAGFEYPENAIAVITLKAQQSPSRRRKKAQSADKRGQALTSLSELEIGDYVVHTMHGIGIYQGIHNLNIDGVSKDYIKIKYAGSDTLYLPVTQLDLVSKYIGTKDSYTLKLHKLGGTSWTKTKTRIKSAIKDIAAELIKLYSERLNTKGIVFSADNEWQKEFEDKFQFEETEDQLRCTQEIKQDMMSSYPMDRLLCGDVGFGKTEVALRAAFKCILDGKQVAMLVPTTILAWQHYNTIESRLKGFPVKAAQLSRFLTPSEQKDVIKKLRIGEIDIVVGTHRLLQQDIVFKDLGLLIIDEEQRFGVSDKELLKEKYPRVDCLTLSATPIPRTLNMALTGIRDLSSIEEAPQDRHPIQTYVLEYDNNIIADAIKKELGRGGQVYYLHNNTETIEKCAQRISSLVADARIGIAHGKMSEDMLTNVWKLLLEGRIDILVCTTIIETGVDVPNVNTLIIEDADKMGLSQLHQIRGRVGRSSRRAFAYFTFRRQKVLTELAAKRLNAIKEYTEFGSGLRIALRDMEIRGAGNILGGEQHGHLDSVGYDMYIKILAEAIREEKGEKVSEENDCMIDIHIEAYIPEHYIESSSQRIEIYKRIASIRSTEDSYDVIDELIDRFGEPPRPVQGLIEIALLRNIAASLNIKEINQKNNNLLFYVNKLDLDKVSLLATHLKGHILVTAGAKPYITYRLGKNQTPLDGIKTTLSYWSRESSN